MTTSPTPSLELAFTLDVNLAPAQTIGATIHGYRRFIPITGGSVSGPKLKSDGKILPGGGDWNVVQPNGIVHLMAKYTISLPEDDGTDTMVTVTNEGIGRASRKTMDAVFGDKDLSMFSNVDMGLREGEGGDGKWYTRTCPRFEVRMGSQYQWLCRSMWLGVMRPLQGQGGVVIDVFEVK